jgi:hypothetical protein
VIAAALLLAAAPVEHAAHATMGVHGMVLFGGREGLFASHLPLFRAPHDRQILIAIKIDDRRLRAAIGEAVAAHPKLWTIEPERFELARLLPGARDPLKTFRATVVDGHFERKGRVAFKDVPFRVERVIVNRPLLATAPPATVTYDRIGRHLVKRLEGRPDMDHVVALAPGPAPRSVTIARADAVAALERALARHAPILTTIYFETGDLR